MDFLKEQTEVAVFISFGREFHKMLPRKDRLSLPEDFRYHIDNRNILFLNMFLQNEYIFSEMIYLYK